MYLAWYQALYTAFPEPPVSHKQLIGAPHLRGGAEIEGLARGRVLVQLPPLWKLHLAVHLPKDKRSTVRLLAIIIVVVVIIHLVIIIDMASQAWYEGIGSLLFSPTPLIDWDYTVAGRVPLSQAYGVLPSWGGWPCRP
jgi:hypothetical protein